MASPKEIEIKFRIADLRRLTRALKLEGFREVTKSTREMNILYDLPDQQLRRRGELLRLRKYGERWVLTHKARATAGRHKSRVERETPVQNGRQMDAILRALGFEPTFRYEKFRAEWSDGKGHLVIDKTPIGDFGEIEGSARWIDRTARKLGIAAADYITSSYAELFFAWKRAASRQAEEMTFRAVGTKNF